MISNPKALETFLMTHGLSAHEARATKELIERECPWFGDSEEVSEEIGVDLLADVLPPKVQSLVGAISLVDWHNTNTRLPHAIRAAASNAAYASLVDTVSGFGVEDGLGKADFWVIEDSFSGESATVMVFDSSALSHALENALKRWLAHQETMKRVQLVDREGDVLLTVG
jgi:hypothetical protein